MDFLDRLGKDTVEQQNRRGRTLVAIDPDAADRCAEASCADAESDAGVDHGRCDRGHGQTHAGSVIS